MKLTSCVVRKNESGETGWLIRFPYDPVFLNDDFKDSIDVKARQWLPEIKSWWVSEDCAFVLAQLFENWNIAPVIKKPKLAQPKVKCPKCHDTGLIPFKNEQDKIVPHAFIYCECHKETAHYRRISPDDFDYPMSYSMYRSLCQEYGWRDPGSDYPLGSVEKEVIHIHRTSDMSKQDYDLLQQTAHRAKYLERKLDELLAKRKPKGRY